jgi:hypothetical protein
MAGTRPGHDDEERAGLGLTLWRGGVVVLFVNMTVDTMAVHPPCHFRDKRGHDGWIDRSYLTIRFEFQTALRV